MGDNIFNLSFACVEHIQKNFHFKKLPHVEYFLASFTSRRSPEGLKFLGSSFYKAPLQGHSSMNQWKVLNPQKTSKRRQETFNLSRSTSTTRRPHGFFSREDLQKTYVIYKKSLTRSYIKKFRRSFIFEDHQEVFKTQKILKKYPRNRIALESLGL